MKLQKTETLNRIIFVVFLIVSSGSSSFVSSALSIIIFCIFMFFLKFKKLHNNNNIANTYTLLALLIVVYGLGVFLQFGIFPNIMFLGRYIFSFLLVAILIIAYKERFFDYLEKAIYFLVVISLVLFGLQLLQFSLLYESMKSFFNILPIDKGFYFSNRNYFVSILVYTINQNTSVLIDQRNCGFVYEPGYFSFFTNMGLLITIAKYNLTNKKRIIIYLLAVFSTFSTTGMIGLIFILAFYFLNASTTFKILFVPIIISAVILFFNISYGYEKVEDLMTNRLEIEDYQKKATQYGSHGVSMGRFAGFQYYAIETWNISPFFGLSILGWRHEANIGIANGTAHFIRNFGFLGMGLMLIATYLSSNIITRYYLKYKYSIILFIFIHLYLFAFPFSNLPIFMIFLVMPLIIRKQKKTNNSLQVMNSYS